MNSVLELYGSSTRFKEPTDWKAVADAQHCPYLAKKCIKVRKSEPDKTIGTCSVMYGKEPRPIIICPYRLLERRQVFADCIHLLTLHEPGNQFHIVPEVSIPGGSVDYFLVSAKDNKVKDFVGIELQTLDTTGTVWPERQRLLKEKGVHVYETGAESEKGYGMNWKMTAKTILVQLHHKVQTFEGINKHLVLVIQDSFLEYMKQEFRFDQLNTARLGDSMHIHTYSLAQEGSGNFHLVFASRLSTDANGIAVSLGLQVSSKVELEDMLRILEAKLSDATLFSPIMSS